MPIRKPILTYDYWTVQQTIRACKYMIKWNPMKTLEWMTIVSARVNSFVEVNCYNQTVNDINEYLDDLESRPYYKRDEYWGPHKPFRLKPLDQPALK